MSTIDTPPIHTHAMPMRRTRRLFMVALLVASASLLYGAYWWSYDRYYV
jgi:multidrug resistance efflux pump